MIFFRIFLLLFIVFDAEGVEDHNHLKMDQIDEISKEVSREFGEVGGGENLRDGLASFEYEKLVPHFVIKMIGSLEQTVLLLGLDGMRFKTIEKKETIKGVKYVLRTYDFVPTAPFAPLAEEFTDRHRRENVLKKYFQLPKKKENFEFRIKNSKFTQQVSEGKVVDNSSFKKNKERILTGKELKDLIIKMQKVNVEE